MSLPMTMTMLPNYMWKISQDAWKYLVSSGGLPDPRSSAWPLMNIYIPIAISILYLLIIPIGTHFMASRPPFRIKTFSLIHNSILFALSLYMVVETLAACYENFGWNRFVQGGWNSGASIFCNANDPKLDAGEPVFRDGFSKSGYRLARVLWIHYVSKAYEFVDTVIMILKKNNRQISFLHVYHHATTFFPVWWAVVTYGPGGEAWFCCFLNSLVHVFMYGYYFFASLGISITIIKKSITKFQMIQFLCFIGQSTWLLFIKDCYSPRLSPWMLLVQCTIFFALFFHFYVTSYTNKNKDKKKVK